MLKKHWFGFLLLCVVVGLWLSWQVLLNCKLHKPVTPADWAIRGQYGDSYGGLNALFAGVALLGVVYTIIMQQRDAEQREKESIERDKHREKEAQRREEEAKKREKERYEDRFEGNFYRLLGIWRSYIPAIESVYARGQYGYPALDDLKLNLSRRLVPITGTVDLEEFMRVYRENIVPNHPVLYPYYRALYYVFRFASKKTEIEDKQEYTDVARALLSESELVLLAANCVDFEKFAELAREFHIFKHAPKNLLWFPRTELEKKLGHSAFYENGDDED